MANEKHGRIQKKKDYRTVIKISGWYKSRSVRSPMHAYCGEFREERGKS